ncbi:phosphatase PAP2 family protein [Aquimarina sp. ERC-38]|uniref:phosphatase PAP2 family protein n=1 Tax=Aquimarina sp. ERC-38 TaxID=2949996 RepID=UPI002245EB65|nr:phosphatase PAP2 family protein [Aquimarina sp. ERC-38]UZO80861.1 phosphatase PAP2 family protein [Aquimarina sp. ERC-38]
MEELIQLDKDLFIYLNNLGSPAWDGFWLFMTEKFYQIPLYFILLLIFYRFLGIKGTVMTLVLVALLIVTSDQLANLFKYVIFQRPRPCRAEGVADFTRFIAPRCGRFGYFSGHATNSFALAIFTILVLRKRLSFIIPLMLIWAIVVSYSRIYVGVHYPLDILTGMVVGSLLGFLAYKLHHLLLEKYSLKNEPV